MSSGLSSTGNAMRMAAEEEGLGFALLETYTTCDLQFHNAKLAFRICTAGFIKRRYRKRSRKEVVNSASLIVPNDIQHLKTRRTLNTSCGSCGKLVEN